jgi:predicted AAA+ superfamily ATPase
MFKRSFWTKLLESAWATSSVLWLTGVPGSGKSSLCQGFGDMEYFDCTIPGIRMQMEDSEKFLRKLQGKKVVLDEIQQVPNHQEILSLAASQSYLSKIIATSPLNVHAYPNVIDTIGEKISQVWLTPIMSHDLGDFGQTNLADRFLRGGLPSFFLNGRKAGGEFKEWVDLFWVKGLQEPFRLQRRNSINRFIELLFTQSGDLFEAKRFVKPCGMSHPTVRKYLLALEASWAVQVIRPFSTRHPTEIISIPKTYAFDTGFFCYFRGWQELRQEDFGILWKHWVLNELSSHLQGRVIHYWRDKGGHEVDFIVITKELGITAIVCQWRAKDFEAKNLGAFRRRYPEGRNWIVCGDVVRAHNETFGKVRLEFMGLEEMTRWIAPLCQIRIMPDHPQ